MKFLHAINRVVKRR